MFLIVGLGNPEAKYAHTYHNVGFMAADYIAGLWDVSFKKKQCRAVTAEYYLGGEKILIAKPVTYMNLSGESVKELCGKYKPDRLAVLYDDIDLPKGTLRIRAEGSAGTHNGMRNIISNLQRTDFMRFRIGIGKQPPNVPLADYVLSRVDAESFTQIDSAIRKCGDALQLLAKGETLAKVMSQFSQ